MEKQVIISDNGTVNATSTISCSDYLVSCYGAFWFNGGDTGDTSDNGSGFQIIRNGQTVYKKGFYNFDYRDLRGGAGPWVAISHITNFPIEDGDTLVFKHAASSGVAIIYGV